jgi:hypothetical protein
MGNCLPPTSTNILFVLSRERNFRASKQTPTATSTPLLLVPSWVDELRRRVVFFVWFGCFLFSFPVAAFFWVSVVVILVSFELVVQVQ